MFLNSNILVAMGGYFEKYIGWVLIYKAIQGIFVIRTYSYRMVINSAIVKPFPSPPPVLEERGYWSNCFVRFSCLSVLLCLLVLLGGASFISIPLEICTRHVKDYFLFASKPFVSNPLLPR